MNDIDDKIKILEESDMVKNSDYEDNELGEENLDFFTQASQIKTWLDKNQIKNYTLDLDSDYDFVVHVDGDVILDAVDTINTMEKIPVKFGHVRGDFKISKNKLTSLKGCPQIVDGTFDCSYNELRDLSHGPKLVGKNYICSINKLVDLKGSAENVGKDFLCCNNQLISLKGGPQKVDGVYDCSFNLITSLKHCPTSVQSFLCYENPLKNFRHCPREIEHFFRASGRVLDNLDYLPETVGLEIFFLNCEVLRGFGGAYTLDGLKIKWIEHTRKILDKNLWRAEEKGAQPRNHKSAGLLGKNKI